MMSRERRGHLLPRIAAVGLVMAGVGLVGMTAGDLPGIPEQIAAPRWLLGAIGGVLVACGWQAVEGSLAERTRRHSLWVELVAFGVIGIVLAALSAFTRADGGAGPALEGGVALNHAARIVFGIGIGIVIGWAAYEGSRSRALDRAGHQERDRL
jgi:hypothetical protein